MRIAPHLSFDGQCQEAFLIYRDILGGATITMLKYGESPLAAEIAPQWHDRIVHATLQLDGDAELTGADLLPHDYKRPQGVSVMLTLEDTARARRVFSALSAGGEVNMAFQATFWSPGFGVLVDRFGIPWEINSAGPPISA